MDYTFNPPISKLQFKHMISRLIELEAKGQIKTIEVSSNFNFCNIQDAITEEIKIITFIKNTTDSMRVIF